MPLLFFLFLVLLFFLNLTDLAAAVRCDSGLMMTGDGSDDLLKAAGVHRMREAQDSGVGAVTLEESL